MADTVRERVVVDAAPAVVMRVISDFAAYPEWQDEVAEAAVLETDAQDRGSLVRFVVDAKLVTTSYVLAYTYGEDWMRWSLVAGEQVRQLDGAYLLADRGDGSTDVAYELAVELAVALPGMIRRQAARRIVDGALRGMRRRAEALA